MEILIPGLILVGFMVWASTRIKRNAAKAFEREEIETGEFVLTKPEGFLAPVDPVEGTVLSAYSKEFGRDDAGGIRQATVEIRRFDGESFDEVRKLAMAGSTELVTEQIGIIAERKCANIVVVRPDKGVPIEISYKIIENGHAVFQLSVAVLPDHKEDLSSKIDLLLSSFSMK